MLILTPVYENMNKSETDAIESESCLNSFNICMMYCTIVYHGIWCLLLDIVARYIIFYYII